MSNGPDGPVPGSGDTGQYGWVPPQYPQGAQPPQPPQPPRKRRGCLYAFLGGVGVVVLLIIIGAVAAAVGGSSNSTATSTPAAPSGAASTSAGATAAAPRQAGLGTPVRDGKFQFVITSVTHAKNVGGQFGQTAQGEYTILHVAVTNIGNVAQTLDDTAQYLYDAKGRKFSADSAADIFANGTSNSVFLNSINPGNTVHGKIAFDLPPGDKAVKAELHDSMFSGGVTVSLG